MRLPKRPTSSICSYLNLKISPETLLQVPPLGKKVGSYQGEGLLGGCHPGYGTTTPVKLTYCVLCGLFSAR